VALLGTRAVCHAMLNHRQLALADLDAALKRAPEDAQLLYMASLVYLQLGEKNRALDALEKAVASGYSLVIVRDTPNFDSLRSDPRFQNLGKGK
jgi:tetratricopeptide (TPR) repeat protein